MRTLVCFMFALVACNTPADIIHDTVDSEVAAVNETDSVAETDPVIPQDTEVTPAETDDTEVTESPLLTLPPDLSPGYINITPAEVNTGQPWGTEVVHDYPALIGDLDGDCAPVLGSADCNDWTCKRPVNCKFEAVFTARRSSGNVPTEVGLAYSYNRASQTWDVHSASSLSALSTSAGIEYSLEGHPNYQALLDLFNDEDPRPTIIDGNFLRQDANNVWTSAPTLDPGPCNTRGGTVYSYGDYDRDGWLDVLQPASNHVIENPSGLSINVTCDQGPVVLQTQTPNQGWLYHNAFPPDDNPNQNNDFHDSYAFVTTWDEVDGTAQVLAMGRPRPVTNGTATGYWVEATRDGDGFPVSTQEEFISTPLGGFCQHHPMGGDQTWYYNPASLTPWRSVIFSTTTTPYITAAEFSGGWWNEWGRSFRITLPQGHGSLPGPGPWGALHLDPDKNGVQDLVIANIADSGITNPGSPAYLMAWWSSPQDQPSWAPFVEWPQGSLGDLNLQLGGLGSRSIGAFDIDSDGDIDIVDAGANAMPRLLRNDTPGNSISISLVGTTSNVLGVGSVIEATLPSGFKIRHSVGTSWNPTIGMTPNYEIGLNGFTTAQVSVHWHSGVVIDYGTLTFDATPGAVNAFVLVEPPTISFSDPDRLMELNRNQIVTICPRTVSGTVDKTAKVGVVIRNFASQTFRSVPVRQGDGCFTSVLEAGQTVGSAVLDITVTQAGVARILNVRPRVWIGANPGFSD